MYGYMGQSVYGVANLDVALTSVCTVVTGLHGGLVCAAVTTRLMIDIG